MATGRGNCSHVDRASGVHGWGVMNNTAFAGHDLRPVHSIPCVNASHCCELCAQTEKCTTWTFVPKQDNPKGPLCWLKDSDEGREYLDGRVSGYTVYPLPPVPPPSPPSSDIICSQPLEPDYVCATCKGPLFSWDVLPVFIHVSVEVQY